MTFDFFEKPKAEEPEGVAMDGNFQCQSPACVADNGQPVSVDTAYWNPQTNVLIWVCVNEHRSSIKDFM